MGWLTGFAGGAVIALGVSTIVFGPPITRQSATRLMVLIAVLGLLGAVIGEFLLLTTGTTAP